MAKRIKEDLQWLPLNPDSLPASAQAQHAAIRALFDQLKTAKAAFETAVDALLVKNAAILPAEAQAALHIEGGKFPVGTVRKFSYMRGVAVATATAAKAKSAGGVSLS